MRHEKAHFGSRVVCVSSKGSSKPKNQLYPPRMPELVSWLGQRNLLGVAHGAHTVLRAATSSRCGISFGMSLACGC